MTLPSADELRSIFAAAREHGVTHLRVGALEVRLAPEPVLPSRPAAELDGAAMVAAINAKSPLPVGDPTETLKREVAAQGRRHIDDPLDIIASGGKLLLDSSLEA